jgi:hypothetical protein
VGKPGSPHIVTSGTRPYPRTSWVSNNCGKRKTCVRFEVFTVVTMKNGAFWDVTPCGSCKYIVFLRRVRRLLVTANIPSSPILSPWWWRCPVPPKHQFLQEPHDITSQETPFFKWKTVYGRQRL